MSTLEPFLPYGRQFIDDADIEAVVEVLRSPWLTCGPKVGEFEAALASRVGARHAVAVNSGTAALHAAAFAVGIGPGDEVIVPPITFAATANCVAFLGGTPVFADVQPDTLLIDPQRVEQLVTPRTKAIIAVDYAGHPCDYDALRELAAKHGLIFIADACHALGAVYRGRPVGSLADLSTFSFHPVKHITTAEGGMIVTHSPEWAARMAEFRTHGITRTKERFTLPCADKRTPSGEAPWYYEMQALGYNYRLGDLNCALGLSQLGKLDRFVERRRAIAALYADLLRESSFLQIPAVRAWAEPAWHIYPVQIDFARAGHSRSEVMQALQDRGVGTQVHYIPVHLQPFYRQRFGLGPGLCPVAESAYERVLSLPMFYAMTDDDVQRVASAVLAVLAA